jgi:hypothetical protein
VRPRSNLGPSRNGIRGRRGVGCVDDPHAEAAHLLFQSQPPLYATQITAASPTPCRVAVASAAAPPLREHRPALPPTHVAPPRLDTGALDPQPPTVIAAPQCGKEHAAHVSCPLLLLRERVPLVTVNPCRPPPWEAMTRTLINHPESLILFAMTCSTSRTRPCSKPSPEGQVWPAPASLCRGSRAPVASAAVPSAHLHWAVGFRADGHD